MRPSMALLLAWLAAVPSAAQTATPAAPRTAMASSPLGNGLLGNLSFTSEKGPVSITARSMEFDYKTRHLTCRGDVVVNQSDMTLRANVLRVKLDERAEDPIREIVAEGDVKIEKGSRVATGGRATFEQANRTIVLTDKPVMRDGANRLTGEKVTVFLDEERSVVEGAVELKLFPENKERRDSGGAGSERRPGGHGVHGR